MDPIGPWSNTAHSRTAEDAWGANNLFFPVALGERLAAAFPDASLQQIADARLFVSLDQPQTVAGALSAFITGRRANNASSIAAAQRA